MNAMIFFQDIPSKTEALISWLCMKGRVTVADSSQLSLSWGIGPKDLVKDIAPLACKGCTHLITSHMQVESVAHLPQWWMTLKGWASPRAEDFVACNHSSALPFAQFHFSLSLHNSTLSLLPLFHKIIHFLYYTIRKGSIS